jgi:hypothetical protein
MLKVVGSARPPNKGMKLTKPERNGALQLIPVLGGRGWLNGQANERRLRMNGLVGDGVNCAVVLRITGL